MVDANLAAVCGLFCGTCEHLYTKCNGCGNCVSVCPVEAMTLVSANDPNKPKMKKASLNQEFCLGCGVCTFLCPTCHCFDILDEGDSEQGERIRIWDSCMFPLFTLHASGTNPRPGGKERMRQRIMHKFSYFLDNHDQPGCTGCGRCIRSCPVNLDIREVLEEIQNLE